MNCNVCAASKLSLVVALPGYPLNSIYIQASDSRERYKPRDLSLYFCEKCGHFQAESGVALNELYNDEYNYNTGNSGVQGRILYFLSQLEQISHLNFNRVIDIGCYDLSLLKAVKKKVKANYFIGVDPSIPTRSLDNSDGIICFKDYVDNVDIPYFNNELPDLVISDQTFEHIPTINATLGNLAKKVSDPSIFAVCVPSMEVLIEKLNFHNLIHEHVNYFSIGTLSNLFRLNNLSLRNYSLNYVSTCGFLFGLFEKSNKASQQEVQVNGNRITKEYFFKYYEMFTSSMQRTREMIEGLNGETIYGFGASDITANLAYFMKSDLSFLSKILDDTDYKQRKYIPYLAPEIISQQGVGDLSHANCLITSPQAARYIYARINGLNFKRIINPIGLVS